MIDLMHVSKIIVGVHAMLGHHAAHGSAVAAIIVLLDPAGFIGGYPEKGADEFADPDVDLLPQIDVMRIQRVVEIEHPGVDVGEGAGGVFHRAIDLSVGRPRERGDPHSAAVMMSTAQVACACCWYERPKFGPVVMGPRVRVDDEENIHHGIAKRSVLPPLDMSTAAKPVTVRPRVPQ